MSVQRSRRASRPTTPLRRSVSRPGNGLSASQTAFPLEALIPAFSELSDSLTDLDTNFQYLEIMHENLSRFSESFAAFLYGLELNAWCVDFQEAPTLDSFERFTEHQMLFNQAENEVKVQEAQDEVIQESLDKEPVPVKKSTKPVTRRTQPPAPKTGTKPATARPTTTTRPGTRPARLPVTSSGFR
ncbi:DASH complex subunit Dam1-domain-containing protein [Lipomyces arxii]|uniref:DASH complex subunit Dam1-domain-containing protein n=1 Tax=Lipomyces arxii TaxID=56418 RepID=UPI0034CD8C92